MSRKNKVNNFTELLADNGDMFFSTGNVDQDYKLITGTIKQQGFWSGVKLRYYFDDDFRLIKTSERVFGN